MTRKITLSTEGAMIGRSAPRNQRPATTAQRTAALVTQFRRCSSGQVPRDGAQTAAGLVLAAIGLATMAFLVVATGLQLLGKIAGTH